MESQISAGATGANWGTAASAGPLAECVFKFEFELGIWELEGTRAGGSARLRPVTPKAATALGRRVTINKSRRLAQVVRMGKDLGSDAMDLGGATDVTALPDSRATRTQLRPEPLAS